MFWLFTIFGVLASWAASPLDLAVDRIDRLYLHRAEVDEASLLRSAARELSGRVHWLAVEAEGPQVVLRHGDGRELGTITVRNMADLPRALRAMAKRVAAVEPASSEIAPDLLEEALLVGVARGLDRYSRVLVGRRIDGFSVRLTGTESGVGVTLGMRDGGVQIDGVVEDGPADRSELVVGDRLVTIDGRAVESTRDAHDRLRGSTGSLVVVTVDGAAGSRAVTLRRERVVMPNVQHRILPGRVGYVHIEHVSQRTVYNLRRSLDQLRRAGALERGLVVDLRDNTGGSMKEAARVADLFVSDGLLLRTEGRDGGPIENLQHEMR
ncbi:MAG: S41 family peptidase, partial [Myxococcota bacterium]